MRKGEGIIPYLYFPLLEETGVVRHAFTTREGGVSTGQFASLNLSFSRGDEEEAVRENFRRVAALLQTTEDRFVFSDQTHTTTVRIVTEADAGAGLTRPRAYQDVDGLITNCPDLVLSVFTADCVPVFLVDPVQRAIGLVHSGWRGTVGRIAQIAIQKMQEMFGTDPADLRCGIGPSICRNCYEIGADVAAPFADAFAVCKREVLHEKSGPKDRWEDSIPLQGKIREDKKYLLDLWRVNALILEETGVSPEHIDTTELCTCCHPDLLFSHRASHGRRGNLGAFLSLQKD